MKSYHENLKDIPYLKANKEGIEIKQDFPQEAYITIANEKYLPLAEMLIKSLCIFSDKKIILYYINCEVPDRFNFYPNLILRGLKVDSVTDLSPKSIYQIMHCKPLACKLSIEEGLERGVFIDADSIAKENIDSIFEYSYEYSGSRTKKNEYPLFTRHYYDYMYFNGIDININLKEYLNVKEPTLPLIAGVLFVFSKDCYNFLKEWYELSQNKDILERHEFYCPLPDEVTANVLLWKYGATRTLPISYLNVIDLNTVIEFEKSKSTGRDIEIQWSHIPNQKETVKIFTSIKDVPICHDVLNHLLKNEKNNIQIKMKKILNKDNINTMFNNTLFTANFSFSGTSVMVTFSANLCEPDKFIIRIKDFEENIILYSSEMFVSNNSSFWISAPYFKENRESLVFEIVDKENNLIFAKKYCKNKYELRMFYQDEFFGINTTQGLMDLIDENVTRDTVMAEIGCFCGVSTGCFANKCKTLYAIDRWEPYQDIPSDINMEDAERTFDSLLLKHSNIIKCKGNSCEKFKDFENEFFDLIYIDGDHSYNGVKQDIENWIPKIKKEGIICGHDYNNHVYNVVNEIFESCHIKKYSDSSWLVHLTEYYENPKNKYTFTDKEEVTDKNNSECIDVIKYNNDDIFIIGSWADTEKKKKTLIDCIKNAKLCKSIPILLVSHLPVPEDVVNLVDYFIYDRDNPLLYAQDYCKYGIDSRWWFENSDFKIEKINPFRHDYAIWTSMRNAFNFVKYLGKDRVYYLEYDCIIDPEEFMREFILPLDYNDACIERKTTDEHCSTFFFSIKVDLALKMINSYKNIDEFYLNKSGGCFLERIFFHSLVEHIQNTFYTVNYKDKFNRINTQNVYDRFKYGEYCLIITLFVDDNKDIYLYIENPSNDIIDIEYGSTDSLSLIKSNPHTNVVKRIRMNNEIIDIYINKHFFTSYDARIFIQNYKNNYIIIKKK